MWAAFMKSIDHRVLLCWAGALLLAALGFFGGNLWALALIRADKGTSLAIYGVNAVQQVFLFAAPALLILAARPARWTAFRQSIRPVSFDTVASTALLAVSGAVVASLIAYLWAEWLQRATGYTGSADPLPIPQNALQWVVAVLAVAVIPALCEETLFRGLIQGMLRRRLGAAGILIAALIFAVAHFRWEAFPALLAVGLALGFAYDRRGLGSSALLHGLYNGVVLILSTRTVGIDITVVGLSAVACAFCLHRLLRKEPENETDRFGL